MNEKGKSDGLGANFVIRKPSPIDMSLYDELDFTNLIQQMIRNYYASKHGKGD